MPPRRSKGSGSTGPSVPDQHAEWLALLRPDGPFLALDVLTEVFGQGLDEVPREVRDRVRQAWGEVQEAPDLLLPAWTELILHELLRLPARELAEAATVAGLPARGRPDLVAYGPDPASGGPQGRAMRLFLYRLGWDAPLEKGTAEQPSPVEQAAAFCRETGVPLALVTNGRLWALVHARPAEASSVAVFDADLWLEERSLLRAFATLLDARRVLAPPRRPDGTWSDALTALFARSAEAHTRVTDTLGRQVRQAVELLVGEFARLDREASGALLADVPEREIYRGALTVLMRLVFLLYAEEQGLLPTLDDLYTDSYAVSTLYDRLEAEQSLHGEEVGDRRSAAWPRLLALFRAVYAGSEHPDLRIPAYGGSLFNPERHTWLARIAVTDRVVHEVLAMLMLLGGRGKAAERLSYKGLDVEQIGHVYEGLLEFSCLKVSEPYVGFVGKLEPELPLAKVEAEHAKGTASFQEWLKKECGLSPAQLKKALAATPDLRQLAELGAACDNDAELAQRVRAFWGLLRHDLRDAPTVFPAGSVLFTQVGDRRATGTHYTPRSLAEEVVKYTLEPLCYRPGPAEGADPADWQVKPAAELLDLNICDPAMGSGAFLVSAVRFLAERLVEAWYLDTIPDDIAEALGDGYDRDALLLMAKRRVAASCIYGVDRDDMAVELAKLSLWIETLAKDKPFSFLDHALRCGDSLVGLIDEAQVVSFHLDPERGHLINARLESVIDEVAGPILTRVQELREEIEANAADSIDRISEKEEKLREAEKLTDRLRTAADAVAGAALSTAQLPDTEDEKGRTPFDRRLTSIADEIQALVKADGAESPLEAELRVMVDAWLEGTRKEPIKPLHWALEFPEVMRRRGFDAVVGNPPFIGGKRVSGALGVDVREYLKRCIAGDHPGNADLCSYFMLRDLAVAGSGRVGLIATNTIAQGDTREVGLDRAVDSGLTIYRAEKSQPWPGTASLEVSLIWVGRVGEREKSVLDGQEASGISGSLNKLSRVAGRPDRLAVNSGKSFQGMIVLGMGFVLDSDEAQSLIERDARNADVIFPYLNGEDLNSRPDCSASRWVIDFNDWPIERASLYPDAFSIVEDRVRPERQRTGPDGSYVLRNPLPVRWWQYADKRPALRKAVVSLDRVLVIAQTSRLQLPAFVENSQVFAHKLVIFPTRDAADLALRTSAFQYWWTVRWGSTMRVDTVFTPSDCCDTLPTPFFIERMERAGEGLNALRHSIMRQNGIGMTPLHNLVDDELVSSVDIGQLRRAYIEVDEAMQEAYALDEEREPEIREFEAKIASEPLPSWREIDLGHGFHETRQGVRFTISPQAQYDVLDKLLALNHYRYKQEVERGLHNRKSPKKSGPARRSKPASAEATLDDGLFAPPDALF